MGESTKDMFETVQAWTDSGSSEKREKAQEALEALIDKGAKPELRWVVDNWTDSGSSQKRTAATKAFRALKED